MALLRADGPPMERLAVDLRIRHEMGILDLRDPQGVVAAGAEGMAELFPDVAQGTASYWLMLGMAAGAAIVEGAYEVGEGGG